LDGFALVKQQLTGYFIRPGNAHQEGERRFYWSYHRKIIRDNSTCGANHRYVLLLSASIMIGKRQFKYL